MKNVYTPIILSIPGKAVVLLGTAALLASGIYGVTQVKRGGVERFYCTRQNLSAIHASAPSSTRWTVESLAVSIHIVFS